MPLSLGVCNAAIGGLFAGGKLNEFNADLFYINPLIFQTSLIICFWFSFGILCMFLSFKWVLILLGKTICRHFKHTINRCSGKYINGSIIFI
jgi:hypothetical protein